MAGIRKRKAKSDNNEYDSISAEIESLTTTRRSERLRRKVFRFMDLPQELRDMIFDQLWLMIPVIALALPRPGIVDFGYSAILSYKKTKNWEWEVYGLPLYLLINKAIYAQALKHLSRHATLFCNTGVSMSPRAHTLPLLEMLLLEEVTFHCSLYGDRGVAMRPDRDLIIPAFMYRFGSKLMKFDITTRVELPKHVRQDLTVDLPYLGEVHFQNLREINFGLCLA